MTWANFLKPDPSRRGRTPSQFSRTTDGGATWSPPVLVDQPGPFAIDLAPRIRVLPNGTLLAIFARGDFETGLATSRSRARSTRGGRGRRPWRPARSRSPARSSIPRPASACRNPAIPARPLRPTAPSTSPSRTARSAELGRDRRRSGRATAALPGARRTLPGVTAFAFEPAIAVDRHGTVGVIWYDLRNDRPGDAAPRPTSGSPTRTTMAPPGARPTSPAPPTSARGAAAQNRFGEYQGLAGLPHGLRRRSSAWRRRRRRTARPTSSSRGSARSRERAATLMACVLVASSMAAVASAGAIYAVTVPADSVEDEARELLANDHELRLTAPAPPEGTPERTAPCRALRQRRWSSWS